MGELPQLLRQLRQLHPVPAPIGWAGDDRPVAITTDQSLDLHPAGGVGALYYGIIAVLGSSQGSGTGLDWVTLAYSKSDGCEILPPQRHTSSGERTDTPIDIACGREAVMAEGHADAQTGIFVTGGSPGAANGGYYEYFTDAYVIFGDTCLTSTGNGAKALGWPRTYGGGSGITSIPARAKYLKDYLYITGTTQVISSGASDMLTAGYYTLNTWSGVSDPAMRTPEFHDQMDFTNVDGSSRNDFASDLELFFAYSGAPILAVTGSSTGTNPSGTGIATQLYNDVVVPQWDLGALWVRNPTGTGNDDEGLRAQMIDSGTNEAEGGSMVNLYITGKNHIPGTAIDEYVSLKYGTAPTSILTLKPTSWTDANIPNTFYSNSGTAGNHIPARIIAERATTTPRRIFVTGTSWSSTSADDWATMFTSEN